MAQSQLDSFTLFQWNRRSLTRKIDLFKHLLFEGCVHVAALCETYLEAFSMITFPNHEIISRDRNRAEGGVALVISKHITFQILKDIVLDRLCSENAVKYIAARLFLPNSLSLYVFFLCSPPRRSGSFTSQDFWRAFFHECCKYSPIIVCGDFNGKSESLYKNLLFCRFTLKKT